VLNTTKTALRLKTAGVSSLGDRLRDAPTSILRKEGILRKGGLTL